MPTFHGQYVTVLARESVDVTEIFVRGETERCSFSAVTDESGDFDISVLDTSGIPSQKTNLAIGAYKEEIFPETDEHLLNSAKLDIAENIPSTVLLVLRDTESDQYSTSPDALNARRRSLLSNTVSSLGSSNPIPEDGLVARFEGKNAGTTWSSSVGSARGITIGGGVNRNSASGYGAEKQVTDLSGDTNAKMDFGQILPATWTLCTLARYTGNTRRRIFQASGNFIHGHWHDRRGIAHYDGWVTPSDPSRGNKHDWLVMCGTNGAQRVYADGVQIATGSRNGGSGNKKLGINYGDGSCCNGETSDWAVAEIMVWNRALSDDEMLSVTKYLQDDILGMAPAPAVPSGVPSIGLRAWFPSQTSAPVWRSAVSNHVGYVRYGSVNARTENGNGAVKTVRTLYGDTGSMMDFGSILPATWTLCTLARYTGNTRRRIFQASGNLIHGHWHDRRGIAHYDTWVTSSENFGNKFDWLVMCGTNNAKRVYADGVNIATDQRYGHSGNKNLGINQALGGGANGETSDWAGAEIMIWNRALTIDEMISVS